ncbi:hypothetical protein K227x_43750 [Rubripirellula lacrimiformis]|uniref:Uncharacterized protein n=1 Tax=Rubripirellula lacrimiformis TaxID=1930273 RepID=A0A517NFW1_9BACT|nr:hypothetical protein K227x_43750 [Rubripirellula lacrimiformis]
MPYRLTACPSGRASGYVNARGVAHAVKRFSARIACAVHELPSRLAARLVTWTHGAMPTRLNDFAHGSDARCMSSPVVWLRALST